MADEFHCSLVTPESSLLEIEVIYANLPAHDGQIGIMHNRAPLLTKLGKGKLHLELANGAKRHFHLEGGFAQMCDNHLTLLSEKALDTDNPE